MIYSKNIVTTHQLKLIWSLVLVTSLLMSLSTPPVNAVSSTKIQVKIIEVYPYTFSASPKFPSTLQLKDINFSPNYIKDCNNQKYMGNTAKIMLASGKIVGERILTRSSKTTYFKWKTDEYGEDVLDVKMTCTGIGTIAVPQSNSYTLLVRFEGQSIGNCSPHYPAKFLKSKKWSITGRYQPDPDSGRPDTFSDLIWSPQDPGDIPTHPVSGWNLLCDRDDPSEESELPVDERGNCEPEGATYRARSNVLYTCAFSSADDGLVWTK